MRCCLSSRRNNKGLHTSFLSWACCCLCSSPLCVSQAPQSLQCGVCLQVVRRDALLALPCQHSFCKACWEQHCTVLVKDGLGVGESFALRTQNKTACKFIRFIKGGIWGCGCTFTPSHFEWQSRSLFSHASQCSNVLVFQACLTGDTLEKTLSKHRFTKLLLKVGCHYRSNWGDQITLRVNL